MPPAAPTFFPVRVPARWSLEAAALEFDVAQITLRRALSVADEVAGPDRCYSTAQIVSAVYGDIASERLRETKTAPTIGS